MAKSVMMERTPAEDLVDLLEHEYRAGRLPGKLADLAIDIRRAFGMADQPSIKYAEDPNLPPYVSPVCRGDSVLHLDVEDSISSPLRDVSYALRKVSDGKE